VEPKALVDAVVFWIPPEDPVVVARRDLPARTTGLRKPLEALLQPKEISSVISSLEAFGFCNWISLQASGRSPNLYTMYGTKRFRSFM
jgi:hypothetical protein